MPLDEIKKIKLGKLEKLKSDGVDPYPAFSARTHAISEARDNFEALEKSREEVAIAGRVMSRREHGGSVFADLDDGSGRLSEASAKAGRIQVFFKKDILGEKEFDFLTETVDVGDFVEVEGVLFKTKKGEETLEAKKFRVLAKSLMPMPEKWHGLQDVEERHRRKYLDLIFNREVRDKIIVRAMVVEHLRQYLLANRFLEVETPILQTLYGGANARPFKTHLDILDIDLYLRIAPELYLKRLLVGGLERVFEVGRVFRNEGFDREHNPEFTMLEFYAAYWDYEKMMVFIEDMFQHLVSTPGVTPGVEIKKPFKRITFNDLLKKYSGLDYDKSSEKELISKAEELGVQINKTTTKGNVGDEIYKKVARPKIVEPTFVINHPVEISPLAKKLPDDPDHVARFQLIVGGMEVVNGFSELNDPLDQRERFEAQDKNAKMGDEEAHKIDDDFIEVLEYGMPPAAGAGIGIDRLAAFFTSSHSVREVITFPLMKPRR